MFKHKLYIEIDKNKTMCTEHNSKFNYIMGGPRELKWDKEVLSLRQIPVSFLMLATEGVVSTISKL
jgi:hypothetical protein